MSALLKFNIGFWVCLSIWLVNFHPLHAQNPDISPACEEVGNPYITNFSPKEYGENPQNWAILQDEDGLMYFGNTHGLLVFDGISWELVKIFEGLVVRSLSLLNDVVYIGASNDLGYLGTDAHGKLKFHSLKNKIPEKYRDFQDVWNTVTVGKDIYFLTADYIFRYAETKFTIWESKSGFHTAFSVNHRFYVREFDQGLKQITGDSLHFVSNGIFFADKRIYSMIPLDDSQILIGTRENGFHLFDGDTALPFPTAADQYLLENQLYHGIKLANNQLAFATLRGGVVILNKEGAFCQVLNKATGLGDERIYFLYPDREKGLWLATNNGLVRIEVPSPLSLFTAATKIESSVESIIRHRERLYAATHLGVYYLEPAYKSVNGDFSHPVFKPIKGPASFVWDLLSFGDYLLAGGEEGVFNIDGTQAELINTSWFDARVLFRSRKDTNRIYVGLLEGLAILQNSNGRWIDRGHVPGLNQEVVGIEEDDQGIIWLGTRNGEVLRLDFSTELPRGSIQIETFGLDSGLPYNTPISPKKIGSGILFATQKGLRRFEPESKHFISDSSLGGTLADTTTWIYRLFPDKKRDIWVIAGDRDRDITGKLIKQSNGQYVLQETPFLRMHDMGNMLFIYPNEEVVWFGASEGIARYALSAPKDYSVAFPAKIRKVSDITSDTVFYYGQKKRSQKLIMDYSHNSLHFEFAGISYEDPSSTQYQVKLEGFDKKWSPWFKDTSKDYTALPEGDYVFQVRAKNIYNNISQAGLFSFIILPPWYRTWWAYAIYTLFFLGILLFAGFIQRNRFLKKEQEHTRIALLEAAHKRKTEELERARKLQLSMLPKEIPQLPSMVIKTYIKTATEVGGDYYDAHIGIDDTLTIALGDATGHGLNAGMIVTATKSVFNSLSDEPDLLCLVRKINHALRKMNFHKLFMALQIARIKDNRIQLCSAGMPPVLIYRKLTRSVEKIVLKGLPLGNATNFPYKVWESKLRKGDTVLLMSDGLAELFNEQGELFGYERLEEKFTRVAHQTPDQIIDHLFRKGEEWRGNKPQNDDITMIVIKSTAN